MTTQREDCAPSQLPAGVVHALISFAESRGWPVDPDASAAAVDDSHRRVGAGTLSDDEVAHILIGLWRHTDDELLGMGRHRLPRGSFRLLCFAVLSAPDLGHALDRTVSFLDALPALSLRIDTLSRGEQVVVEVPTVPERCDDPRAVVPLVEVLVVQRLITWAVGRDIPGALVELPSLRPLEEVAEVFPGCEVLLRARRAAFCFDRAALSFPIARSEQEIEEMVAGAPCSLLTPSFGEGLGQRVRRLLAAAARNGEWVSAQRVARQLLVSEQTLRRRLQDERTSFRSIVAAVRREAALTSLSSGHETVAELARRLGYSEPSAFTRAFHRWTGSTPSAYRDEA